MAHVNIVSPEAVIFLTAKEYAEVNETWLPNDFIVAQPAQQNHDGTTIGDIDVEHFCFARDWMYNWLTKMFHINVTNGGAVVILLCWLCGNEIVGDPCLAYLCIYFDG